MPKEMTASEEYTRAQEQTSLERVFNNLDKKGDGKGGLAPCWRARGIAPARYRCCRGAP